MTTLENILQEIEEIYINDVGLGVECNIFSTDEECKSNSNCIECAKRKCIEIVKKHLSDNDGMINIDNEHLWKILFEEACVEGQQAERIHKRLEEICGNGWIACSERLPGTQKVLITDGDIVMIGYRRPDGVWKFSARTEDVFSKISSIGVIAWQPLPEPYRKSGE